MTQLLTAFTDGMLAFGALAGVCCLALWLLDKVDSRRYALNLERAAQKERDAAVREAERILGGVA